MRTTITHNKRGRVYNTLIVGQIGAGMPMGESGHPRFLKRMSMRMMGGATPRTSKRTTGAKVTGTTTTSAYGFPQMCPMLERPQSPPARLRTELRLYLEPCLLDNVHPPILSCGLYHRMLHGR